MRVKDALKKLNQYIKLMQLHDENQFKIKQFTSFIFELDSSGLGLKQLLNKAQKGEYKLSENKQTLLWDLLETGSFDQFDQLLSQTPVGVLEMMKLPGLGPKKLQTIWKELNVTDLKGLKEACLENRVSELKGFGKKTEQSILEAVDYLIENKSRLLISQAQFFAESIIKELKDYLPQLEIEIVGELKRHFNVINSLQLAIKEKDRKAVFSLLDGHDLFEKEIQSSSPFKWTGFLIDVDCPLEIIVLTEPTGNYLLKLNSNAGYLASLNSSIKASSEEEFYQKQEKIFIPSEMREFENIDLLNSPEFKLEKTIQARDIKGCLHNHSVYSDGQNTISEMAAACKQLGLTYFGISDHSQTASYAGGLKEEDIIRQHQEIEDWNSRSTGFKIFKGIESDILNDGSLDYTNDVLKSFDFIVSSIHANLTMKKEDATSRLIKAIENPYTTILGHPTGRLLLKRKGYEIDHEKIIDACAANNVVIEINSNPWRLDIDWQYVRQCADKGVLLAINPDAHEVDGIHDMQYGLLVARKAGLYPEQVLNCMDLSTIENFFSNRLKNE